MAYNKIMGRLTRTQRLQQAPPWHRQWLTQALFADLKAFVANDLPDDWPSLDQLHQMARTRQAQFLPEHKDLCFCHQSERLSALQYEQYIASQRCIPTRGDNWHDVFNAWMWMRFPASKSQLNQLHVNAPAQTQTTGNQRSRPRDFATLLDESGVIIACSHETLKAAHQEHHWQELFVEQRSAWGQSIRAYIIGHGLYEQCLTPYIGLTAKAIYLDVAAGFFKQTLEQQYQSLDQQLQQRLSRGPWLPRSLLPLPLLGVPTWWPNNEATAFYSNTDYFRPKRQPKP